MEDDDETPKIQRNSADFSGAILVLFVGFTPLSQFSFYTFASPTNAKNDASIIGIILSIIIGFIIPQFQSIGWRALGYVPIGITVFYISGILVLLFNDLRPILQISATFFILLTISGILRHLRSGIKSHFLLKSVGDDIKNPPFHPRPWELIFCTAMLFGMSILGLLSLILPINLSNYEDRAKIQQYCFCMNGLLLTVYSWIRLARPAYELWVESWIRIMYKIHGHGPGNDYIPKRGPILIVANHACWWDPLFIAAILPRPITAMMTASFYDIWHLKPFMKHVVHAIRVPEKQLRFEAPEIKEAIAALNRGECVVIFAEGYLRRKEEVPLRRFGRGVHEILKGRPETPVVAGWIEGAWGSWCSWKNGPPTKNKQFDVRRKIEIGLSAPFTVPAAVLENHWQTRVFLMNAVSAARKHVGLEPLPEFSVPTKGGAEESPT